MRLICRNTPIILNLPFDRLRRRGEADDVILEMGEATGLHVPIAAAIANAQRLGDPILQEGFELVAPSPAVVGNGAGEITKVAADAQPMGVPTVHRDIGQPGGVATELEATEFDRGVDAEAHAARQQRSRC